MNYFLLDVIEFKVSGDMYHLTENLKQEIEKEIRTKTKRLMGANTTVRWITFEQGSILIYEALVTSCFIAGNIILNYKPFKESVKELIKDVGSCLEKLFKVETEFALNESVIDDVGVRYLVKENGYIKINSTNMITIEKGKTKGYNINCTESY